MKQPCRGGDGKRGEVKTLWAGGPPHFPKATSAGALPHRQSRAPVGGGAEKSGERSRSIRRPTLHQPLHLAVARPEKALVVRPRSCSAREGSGGRVFVCRDPPCVRLSAAIGWARLRSLRRCGGYFGPEASAVGNGGGRQAHEPSGTRGGPSHAARSVWEATFRGRRKRQPRGWAGGGRSAPREGRA